MRQIILDMIRYSNTREMPPSLAALGKEIGEQDLYFLCVDLLAWCQNPCIPRKLDLSKAFPRVMRDAISRAPGIARVFVVDKSDTLANSRRVSAHERFEIAKYVKDHYDERFGHSIYVPTDRKPPAAQDELR